MCEADGFNRPIEIQPEHTPPKNLDRPIESTAPEAASDPTRETYVGWNDAYDFLNAELFGGALPPCRITCQHGRLFYGYYAADRFVAAEPNSSTARIDEIAINSAPLHDQPVEHALARLFHEMAHLKRYRLIEPRPTPGYHDQKWAQIMIDAGLVPSTTGEPGGKTTGQKVSHYIIPGGPFDLAAQELVRRGFSIRYIECEQMSVASAGGAGAGHKKNALALRRARSKASKTLFSCVNCKRAQKARAKPGAHLICGDCNTPMLSQPSPRGV